MKTVVRWYLYFVSMISVLSLRADYVKRTLKEPVVSKASVTYVADDESYDVSLSFEDIRLIENILKPHVTFDEDYNKKINRGFIRRILGSNRYGEKTELVKKVLNDFRGKTVAQLYTALGMRREL